MNTLIPSLYLLAIIVSAVTATRSYRNRFLPMATPIGVLSMLLMYVCSKQWLVLYGLSDKTIDDLQGWSLLLHLPSSFAILPLWVWVINEYRLNQKLAFLNKRTAFLWVEPIIALMVCLYSWFVLPGDSSMTTIDALGRYQPIHRAYMLALGAGVLAYSIYVVGKKNKHRWSALFQFGVSLALPMLLFYAYELGHLEKPIGASLLILILMWAARESSLLDVIPSALSGVLDRIDAGIVVFNAQNALVYSNQFAKELLQLSPLIKINKLHPELHPLLERHFDFTSDEPQQAQIQFKQNDLPTRFIKTDLQSITNQATSQNLGHIVLFQDISAGVMSEQTLAESNRKLSNLNRQKSDFFAGISHEFRTPLTLSLGEVQDLIQGHFGEISDSQTHTLRRIERSNRQLLSLVNQLIELARLDHDASSIQPQKIMLEPFIENVLANFDGLLTKKQTRVSINSETASPVIYFDPLSLEKIISNLISNAFKSIEQNGNINIDIKSEDQSSLSIVVKDNGRGIAADSLPHIFDAFYSQSKPSEHWPGGTGVGLYLVKQLLEKHRASIAVVSELGRGSEFIVTIAKGSEHLTLTDEPSLIHRTIPSAVDSSDHLFDGFDSVSTTDQPLNQELDKENLILVVEDNVAMRRYIRRHLANSFRLMEAENGDEAYELAIHSVPDLIITDLMMPKTDGLHLVKRIRETTTTSHIPMIMLTAKSEQQTKLDSFDAGVDAFVLKPFNEKELLHQVRNLIRTRERLAQHYRLEHFNKSTESESQHSFPEREQSFLDSLQEYSLKHIGRRDLRISELAEQVHMSERSLQRKLTALTGLSPKQWLMKTRVELAAKRLRNSDFSLTNIALDVGFADSAHFSKVFKSFYSVSPSAYRQDRSNESDKKIKI